MDGVVEVGGRRRELRRRQLENRRLRGIPLLRNASPHSLRLLIAAPSLRRLRDRIPQQHPRD